MNQDQKKKDMKVLVVSRYKVQYAANVLPFVGEQYASLREAGCEAELFLLQGNYWKQWKSLRRKIREFKPNVIHAHYGLSCLVANLATRRVPVVSTYHGSDINLPKVRLFSKMAMWLSAWNLFVSKRNVEIAQPKQHWSLIPCGVNLPLSWDELKTQKVEQLTLNQWVETIIPKGKKYVLFAGAFDNAVKDPELAKASVTLLDNVQLIELKGYSRDQVNALMYNCDAFLMTSKTEGSPQVIKEAMACGCPIVSVDVGDVAERTEGVDGCYVVSTREPRDIADALEKAIAFEGKTKGRERIKDMMLDNMRVAERLIDVYESILNN